MTNRRATKRLAAEELFHYAVKALAARAHSVAELRQKLRQRAERKTDADGVIRRLKQYGYLDDAQFADFLALQRREAGYGERRVLADLRSRKVAPELAQKAVRKAFAGVEETELIMQFLARKFRRTPLEQLLREPKHLAAVYRKLRAAGFSGANVLRVLKRYASCAETLELLEAAEEPPAE